MNSAKIEEAATNPPSGISTGVQLVWLALFVLVLYELLHPHLGRIVSAG